MNKLQAWWYRSIPYSWRPKTAESDRARVAKMIIREAAYADALCNFLCDGFNYGKAVKITIEIDGVACEVGILATGNEPLMEYLANWSVGEKLKKMDRLEQFYDGIPAVGGVVDKDKAADLGAAPKNVALGP